MPSGCSSQSQVVTPGCGVSGIGAGSDVGEGPGLLVVDVLGGGRDPGRAERERGGAGGGEDTEPGGGGHAVAVPSSEAVPDAVSDAVAEGTVSNSSRSAPVPTCGRSLSLSLSRSQCAAAAPTVRHAWKAGVVLPAGVDEVPGVARDGAEQLVAEEPGHLVHAALSEAGGEPGFQLRSGSVGDGDGVDLHDRHAGLLGGCLCW